MSYLKATAIGWCCMAMATIGPAAFSDDGNPFTWPEPARENRPWSYWWWMGSAVDEEHLAPVLAAYRDAGLGGLHIIPIYGAKGAESRFIPYLSPRWMEMLKFTIAEADRLDMSIDMTTGTGWPFGGPVVEGDSAASKVEHANTVLKEGETHPPITRENLIAAFGIEQTSNETVWLDSDPHSNDPISWTAPAGSWTVYVLRQAPTGQRVKRAAPGAEGPVVNPFSVEAMSSYLRWFDGAFAGYGGLKLRAQYHDSYEYYNANWSPQFFGTFQRTKGYDLKPHLPLLLGHGDPEMAARVRGDFRDVLSQQHLRFIEHWTTWARDQGWIARQEAHGAPANLIDCYAAADVPETEIFGPSGFPIPGLRTEEDSDNTPTSPLILKFASSAAHLKGTPLVSSETCTWLGEHFNVSLGQAKTEIDQLFTTGINHIFYHGIAYSPLDEPWPGWLFYASVSFAPSNPFFRDFHALNSYITRCQSVLQSSRASNDILLYFPIQDIWHEREGNLTVRQLGVHNLSWLEPGGLRAAAELLWSRGYGFDYVSDRFITTKGAIRGNYRVMVVPDCHYMPNETLRALMEHAEDGLTVILQGDAPRDVPGFADLDARRARQKDLLATLQFKDAGQAGVQVASVGSGRVIRATDIEVALMYCGIEREPMRDAGLTFIRREHDGGHIYFIVNLGAERVDRWITLGVDCASTILMDPRFDSRNGVAALRTVDRRQEIYLQLEPGESCVLKTFATHVVEGPHWQYAQSETQSIAVAGPWTVTFIEGGPEIPKPAALQALTSWTTWGDPAAEAFGGAARYTTTFEKPDVGADDWLLDLGEVCETAKVFVNGSDAGTVFSIPFRVPIGPFLKEGSNELTIEVTNLAANRIRDMDKRGVDWKRFHDANIVNLHYKPFDASNWPLRDSGLLGPVRLIPVSFVDPA